MGEESGMNGDFERFAREFPNVKPESIDRGVWLDVQGGMSLSEAYLRSENRRLMSEAETERKNRENREKAAPSAESAGKAAARDPFDEGWNEE